MLWVYVFPVLLLIVLSILIFTWWRSIFKEKGNAIRVYFFVCNVQDYFEGLMWDLKRISNWWGKDIAVYVTDLGSEDETPRIIKLLESKGFLQQLSLRQGAKYLRTRTDKVWIFNLKKDTDVKETRKYFVRAFTEHIAHQEKQKELF